MSKNPIFWAALAFLALLTVTNSFFIVDQREKAILFQLGELRGKDFAPGLHMKTPFFQDVRRFDGRILTLDNQTENFLTVEKKNVEVDFYVKWRIADAAVYYRATGGQEIVASDRLSSILNRGLRDQFGNRTIQQAVADDRDAIVQEVEKDAAIKVKDLGIGVVDIRIKSINLPKNVSESVYDRMRAERTGVAADLRARGAEDAEKIRAEADRTAQVTLANAYKTAETLKGEGDARAAEIYAKAYGQDPEFYSFYRTLNIYRDSFSGSHNIMVLEPKGELFRYFKGSGNK
ncbi:protease modulator HflC [Solimonas sp. K1W22B-7]|uniref:protease modulator HflC n=1 Tax=Solimonas sp. K1W22B-7 TaxID=2303331 RepID=UPI000E32E7F8|nr:protease modulator HflC [Solimonas sp. K1W22B-7]AXQ29681.1 protease modulator HflC [Solimonas sp. K1W22B-7]